MPNIWGLGMLGPFLYIVHWVELPSMVMGPTMLDKGVETNLATAQPGLVCAQTMSRLPKLYLQQAELFQRSHGR